MVHRTSFFVAAALTAFALVLAGTVASRLPQEIVAAAQAGNAAVTTAATPAETSTPSTDPLVQKLLQDRQTLIQEVQQANQRLQQANQELQKAQQNLAEASAAQQAPTPTQQPTGRVSQDQAAQIATSYLGGGEVLGMKVGTLQGALAYQVDFTDGSQVIVDANSGQVLAANAATGNGGGEDGDDDD